MRVAQDLFAISVTLVTRAAFMLKISTILGSFAAAQTNEVLEAFGLLPSVDIRGPDMRRDLG